MSHKANCHAKVLDKKKGWTLVDVPVKDAMDKRNDENGVWNTFLVWDAVERDFDFRPGPT